ncbi:hypothetical protein ACFLZ1_00915 [Patescibacteria group bacterium]
MNKNKIVPNFVIFFLFLCFTFLYFKPLILNFSTFLPGNNDELHLTWAIYSLAEKLPASATKLFTGNIFYPHPYSRSYGDPLITSSVIAKFSFLFSKEPIIAFNINLIISQIMLLYFSFLFLNLLTNNKKIAVLLSLIYGFSNIHLHYLHHINYFSIQWLPLTGYFLLKLRQTRKPIHIYLFFLSFVLQTLNSFLLGYFVVFLSLGLYFFDKEIKKCILKNLKHFLLALLISFIILFPILSIYFQVSQHFNHVTPLTEVIHFSLSPEEIFTKFASPVLYLLTIFALISFFITKKKNKKSLSFLLLLTISFIISLGPALHWMKKTIKIPFHIPLPYLVLYYLIPGFKAIRVPSRWILMTGFLTTAFVSIELKNMALKHSKKINAVLIFAFLLFLLIFKPFNSYSSIPQLQSYPPVYSWLEKQTGNNIIELPINTWGQGEASKKEALRMLYSLKHKKKLVNGSASFTPPSYYEIVSLMKNNFPDEKTINTLKKMKIDYIILHKKEYEKLWLDKTEKKLTILNSIKSIDLIAEFDSDLVYKL